MMIRYVGPKKSLKSLCRAKDATSEALSALPIGCACGIVRHIRSGLVVVPTPAHLYDVHQVSHSRSALSTILGRSTPWRDHASVFLVKFEGLSACLQSLSVSITNPMKSEVECNYLPYEYIKSFDVRLIYFKISNHVAICAFPFAVSVVGGNKWK